MPAQICTRELIPNLLGLLASAADQLKRDTALELVRSPAAMSTIRLTIALSAFRVHVEAHACLVGEPHSGSVLARARTQKFSSKSIVDC